VLIRVFQNKFMRRVSPILFLSHESTNTKIEIINSGVYIEFEMNFFAPPPLL